MAGNARGQLKEHYEGIHRNLDWCIHHIQASLQLIAGRLAFTEEMVAVKGNADEEEKVLMANDIYKGTKALGEGIQTLDELAQQIYANL